MSQMGATYRGTLHETSWKVAMALDAELLLLVSKLILLYSFSARVSTGGLFSASSSFSASSPAWMQK